MPEESGSIVLSTATVSRQRQFAYWRDAVCETFMRLQVDRAQRSCFRGEIKSSGIGALNLHRVDAQPLLVRLRPPDLRHRNRDCLYVNFQTAGESFVSQNGRESAVRAGQWYVLDGMSPFDLHYSQDFVTLNLEIPRQIFRAKAGDEATLTGLAFGASSGVERVLRDIAQSLSVEADSIPEDQTYAVSSLFLDVLGLALNPRERTGGDASRRLKIERFVRANLENSALSAPEIARGCNISLRTLHATFAADGETVMRYVRICRMRFAAHLLRAEAKNRSITEIAFASGFKDSASFSRSFRQNFGITPRQYRSGAKRPN